MPTWTISGLLQTAADYLARKGSSSPRLDAELLLAEALGVGRVDLYVEHERPLTQDEVSAFRELIARRAKLEPVAYILGRASFRYQTLEVCPSVLVPRPETEELVDAVLEWLKERPLLGEGTSEPAIADVGTGSGAIALSLAAEAGVRVLAVDSSPAALAVAARNRQMAGLEEKVELRQADLLVGVGPASLRLVVANPPYVAESDRENLPLDVLHHEPKEALFAGADGLDVIRRLLPQSAEALGPGGSLFLEIGHGQEEEVRSLAEDAGFVIMRVRRDLSGKPRIVHGIVGGALRLDESRLTDAVAEELRSALAAGAVLGVPTDTVYGLAAAWDSQRGVTRLFEVKGREEEKPLAVMFSSVEVLERCLPDLSPAEVAVLRGLLPGPYTFVVDTQVKRAHGVGTEDSLGVRVPNHPLLFRLLGLLRIPLAATSANVSGGGEAVTAGDVAPALLAHCVAALASPPPPAAAGRTDARPAASTIVDLRPLARGGAAAVIREGIVPGEEVLAGIAAVLDGPRN